MTPESIHKLLDRSPNSFGSCDVCGYGQLPLWDEPGEPIGHVVSNCRKCWEDRATVLRRLGAPVGADRV